MNLLSLDEREPFVVVTKTENKRVDESSPVAANVKNEELVESSPVNLKHQNKKQDGLR